MKIKDLFKKKKKKEEEIVSWNDLYKVLEQSKNKWKEIVEFLKEDLGNIWYPKEIGKFEEFEEMIKKMKIFLEKNKVNFPKIEKEIDELIQLLDLLIKERAHKKININDWFIEVKGDFFGLYEELKKNLMKYNAKLMEEIKKRRQFFKAVSISNKFITVPYRSGEIAIGFTRDRNLVNRYSGVKLVEISSIVCDAKRIIDTKHLMKEYKNLNESKKILVIPKSNIPQEFLNKIIREIEYINDGGRSAIGKRSCNINLNIFGCKSIQEFREARKGVGYVPSGGEPEPILPVIYDERDYQEKRPHGGQLYSYALGSINTTEEILSHPEYKFKFCPTFCVLPIPPEFMQTGYNNYFHGRTSRPLVKELLNNTVQEIGLVPSTVRLGSFYPAGAIPEQCHTLLQSIAPFPAQMDLIIPQLMEDYVNYFSLVARTVKEKEGKISIAKIGDITLGAYIDKLNHLYIEPKEQGFFGSATPISKDIVIAQSGLYFKDLESLNLNYTLSHTYQATQMLKFQMAYLFYDVGMCLEFLIALSDLRKESKLNIYEIHKIRRKAGRDAVVGMYYDIPPNEYFLKTLIELFKKSKYLYLKEGPHNCLSLGINTSIGKISFETFIDLKYCPKI